MLACVCERANPKRLTPIRAAVPMLMMLRRPEVKVKKNITTVNYHGNFNTTNSRVKILQQITVVFMFATLGQCYETLYQGYLLQFYGIYCNTNVL